MKYAKIAARDGKQSDHLPYLRHVHDRVIKTKQGFYLGVIRLNGLCFQTLDQSEINLRFIGRNQTVTGLGSSRYALYGHVIRREVDPRVEGTFDNPFVQELDARYMAAISSRKMFQNEIYISVLRRPMQGKVGVLDQMVQQFKMVGSEGEGEADILRELSDTLDAIARDMAAYGARVLSVVERKDGFFTEPGEFLAKTE